MSSESCCDRAVRDSLDCWCCEKIFEQLEPLSSNVILISVSLSPRSIAAAK